MDARLKIATKLNGTDYHTILSYVDDVMNHLVVELPLKDIMLLGKNEANPVLYVWQSPCDKCQFKKRYITGADEYPAYTNIEYCSK